MSEKEVNHGCVAKINFTCNFYTQTQCVFFHRDETVPSTICIFGRYERQCNNPSAKNIAIIKLFLNYIKENSPNGCDAGASGSTSAASAAQSPPSELDKAL
jgi:hypothetical protein